MKAIGRLTRWIASLLSPRGSSPRTAVTTAVGAVPHETEERYRLLVELSPNAILIHDGEHIVFANPAALRLFRAERREALIGKPILDIVGTGFREVVRDRIRLEIEKRQQVPPLLCAVRRLDGTDVEVEAIPSPFPARGRPHVQCVFRDVTLERTAERAREHNEARLRSILEALPCGIIHTATNGDVLWVNHVIERALDLRLSAIQGRPFRQFPGPALHEDGSPFSTEDFTVAKCLRTGLAQPAQTMGFRKPNGIEVWGIYASIPHHDPVTRVFSSVITTFLDVTELRAAGRALRESEIRLQTKQLELQLIQAEKLASLGQLSAGMAHEINNPLTGILGFASILRRNEEDPKRRDYLERIVGAANRISKIVLSMRHFASPSHQDRRLVRIDRIVEDTLSFLENEIARHDVRVETDFAETPETAVDPNQLQQVFTNLVMNALQAMGTTPRVLRIEVGQAGTPTPEVQVRFRDTGRGIAREVLPRIFDPFFTTKADWQGTGLGLSVAFTIVRNHGGRIEGASTPGEGSTFTVSLPVVAEPAAASIEPAASAPRGPLPPVERVRVLLVEDEDVIIEMVRAIPGVLVTAEATGRAGLSRAADGSYDLAVVDLRLPDMSGAEVASILERTRPELPVLLVTGCHDTDPLLVEAQGKTRCEILHKPFSGDELTEKIARILEERTDPRSADEPSGSGSLRH